MKFLDKIKNNVSTFVYSVFGVVTLVSSVAMLIWCIQGEKELTMNIIKTDVIVEDVAQKEYLVGQEFNTNGLYLKVQDQNIPASQCTISNDFSTSGRRSVTISYSVNENNTYEGTFDVNVLFVRNIFVEKLPTKVEVNEDNTFTADEDFQIYAELATRPETSEFVLDEKFNDRNIIALNEKMYTTNVIGSSKTPNFYTANLYCGNLNYSFNFYNNADKTFIVDAEKDIVKFSSDKENQDMILVVTSRDESYQTECIGNTEGFYIYSINEKQTLLPFKYQLSEKQEHFLSENITESHDLINNEYSLIYANTKFTVDASLFQSAVVNGLIYDDNGYKMVIDSDSRILNFTYLGDKTIAPKLTLYVTDYHFESSTGSGVSQGFYMYTNSLGENYKIRFYLQTWTWDHVPLSITKTDVYSDAYVGDYLTTKYSGDLQVSATYFVRGIGWTENDLFTATFDQWRLVAYNMA